MENLVGVHGEVFVDCEIEMGVLRGDGTPFLEQLESLTPSDRIVEARREDELCQTRGFLRDAIPTKKVWRMRRKGLGRSKIDEVRPATIFELLEELRQVSVLEVDGAVILEHEEVEGDSRPGDRHKRDKESATYASKQLPRSCSPSRNDRGCA